MVWVEGDMSRELLRRAAVALQHGTEARTLEYQVKHAEEARAAFQAALRSLEVRRENTHVRPNEAAKLIAARAVMLEARELEEFEKRLHQFEETVAERIVAEPDLQNYRVLRIAE
jgi:hypothetical protein